MHCLFGRSPIPRRRESGINAPEGFVAPGALGMRLAKHPPRSEKRDASSLRFLPSTVLSRPYAFCDALLRELDSVVERELGRHPKFELHDLRPVAVVGVEVVGRPLDLHHAPANIPCKRVCPRPVLGVADGPCFDGVTDEVGERFDIQYFNTGK